MQKLSHFFIIGFISILVLLASCNGPKQKIANLDEQLTLIEKNGSNAGDDDWKKLQVSIEELTADLKTNRDNYSDEQLKEIGRIYARYTKISLKKGFKDFKNDLEDLNSILQGFGDELGSTDTTDS